MTNDIALSLGSLALETEGTFKVPLIVPGTEDPVKDKDGREAYIEVRSFDSAAAQKVDKANRLALNKMVMRGKRGRLEQEDPLDQNIEKTAALTVSWYLVDPRTKEPNDMPCTLANVLAVYTHPKMRWMFRLAFEGASETANFTEDLSTS